MKKVLVAYFSASGTTKELAENLAHIAEQILDTLQQGQFLLTTTTSMELTGDQLKIKIHNRIKINSNLTILKFCWQIIKLCGKINMRL